MNIEKLQISILGCGWLGLPLAETLAMQGHSIKGSTTTPSRVALLKQKAITPYLIELREHGVTGPIREFLRGSEILVIDIPPGFRKDPSRDFLTTLKSLVPCLADAGVQHILYVSSTSVFPESNRHFHEEDEFMPNTLSGKQLRDAEKLIMALDPGKNTVLRLGGLIGSDRHPVHYLSGRKDLPGGSDPVNLIHRTDAIGIISAIINTSHWGKVLHGVAPCHMTKREYYHAVAGALGIPAPIYKNGPETPTGKVILSDKTTALLNYRFTYPAPGL